MTDMTPIIPLVSNINVNQCMSRKNRKEGLLLQCPNKKKTGDYCQIHAKVGVVFRVDKEIPSVISSKKKVKIKIRRPSRSNDVYASDEMDGITSDTVDYSKMIRTLRYYMINIEGPREVLLFSLINFFTNRYISANTLTPYLEQLSGPGYHDRSVCDNVDDFFDMTPVKDISSEYFFSYTDDKNGRIYGFDIRSLHRLVETSKRSPLTKDMNKIGVNHIEILNPYTRTPLNATVLGLFEEKRRCLLQNHIPIDYPEEQFDETTKYNMLVLDTFQIIYGFGYTEVNHSWFMNLSRERLIRYFWLLEDIWNYRLQLTTEQKQKIVPLNDIFTGEQKSYLNKYRHNSKLSQQTVGKIVIDIVRKMIMEGVTKSDCINGALYVLVALVQISTEAANALPHLVSVT